MKKIFAMFLVLVMVCTFGTYAMADEAVEVVEPQGFVIDLTQIITSFGWFLFSVILAWLIKAVIPPIKNWLDAKTTAEQQAFLYQLIKHLVNAAEQMIGRGKGSQKLQYVMTILEEKGFEVDLNLIEAAVKEMNDEAEARILAAMRAVSGPESKDDETEDDDEPDAEEYELSDTIAG